LQCFKTNELKKAFSISLLLIAGLVIILHDLIPHHSHAEDHCIAAHSHENCDHNHLSDDHHEETPENREESCCQLGVTNLFHVPNHYKNECICCQFLKEKSYFLSDYFNSQQKEPTFHTGFYFRQHPTENFKIISSISLNAGLRAPPVAA
jgi:hypothetical protein